MTSSVSLADRLGGPAGVKAAVAQLYDRLLDDLDVAEYFDDVDLPSLRAHMVDFLVAAVTGAEDGYSGRPLDVAHRGRGITDTAFDRVVHHVHSVLQDAGADPGAVDNVITLLRPLRAHVVL